MSPQPGIGILVILLSAFLACVPAIAEPLPAGFAYIANFDDTIVQDMHYAGAENFTGAPVPGYEAGECILAKPVAAALARVQTALAKQGRTLIVHDCYRPARAVRAFVKWADGKGEAFEPRYHPRVARNRLIAEGYIAARSGHSSGGSVDLTFGARYASGNVEPAEMGSRFDLFDAKSHTASSQVGETARKNRKILVEAMKREGFANYAREWWHFRFTKEPFAGKVFDFPVVARQSR